MSRLGKASAVGSKSRKLMTSRETCEHLGITRNMLWSLVQSGQLPCVRISTRTLRYRPEDVDAFVAAASSRRKKR